jgi:phosphatidate cytidylyltransferase
MLRHRVATAAVGLPLIVLAVWFDHPWFTVLMGAAALAGTYEFYRMAGLDRRERLLYLGLAWSLSLVLSHQYRHSHPHLLPLIITAAIVISLLCSLRRPSGEKAFHKWAWAIAGAFYVGWMLGYWLSLRGLQPLEAGRNWVYLALLTTFANDTGAYFIGRARGKHRLAPTISPAKTTEGALGGLACSVIAAVIIATVLNLMAPFGFGYWQIILLGLLIGVFAQLGDLVESLLKRSTGLRQSGDLLPGHGGVLDRFDSLIFVGPLAYYYVIWLVL